VADHTLYAQCHNKETRKGPDKVPWTRKLGRKKDNREIDFTKILTGSQRKKKEMGGTLKPNKRREEFLFPCRGRNGTRNTILCQGIENAESN